MKDLFRPTALDYTLRKIMLIQLIDTLEGMLASTGNDPLFHSLKEARIAGILIKGSGEFCINDERCAIPRNPRDIDMVVLARRKELIGHDRTGTEAPSLIHKLLKKAAYQNGFSYHRATDSDIRGLANKILFNKAHGELEITLSPEWIDRALAQPEHYRLLEREISLLEKAKQAGNTRPSRVEVNITMDQPQQDLPPLDRHGHTWRAGIAVNDTLVSLLNKIAAVNNQVRSHDYDPNFDVTMNATDKLDIYNLYQRINQGNGLTRQDLDTVEYIIQNGKNYPFRQRMQKVEANLTRFRHDGFRGINLRGILSDRDTITATSPTPEAVRKFHSELTDAYQQNIIGTLISMEKAEEILALSYNLSLQIFDKSPAVSSSQKGVFTRN